SLPAPLSSGTTRPSPSVWHRPPSAGAPAVAPIRTPVGKASAVADASLHTEEPDMTPTTDSATTRPDVAPAKLDAFMGKVLTDMGGALDAALILIGDKLGLFRALAEAPMSSADLAARTT